ncbi:tetratricopeptide repeat protein [Kaarinaea lacus]
MGNPVLHQLKVIKWLLFSIVLTFLTIAGSIAFGAFSISSMTEDMMQEYESSECGDDYNFKEEVDALIDTGKLDDAISMANTHIETYPNDHDGYWYLGIALYLNGDWSESIEAMNKVEQLAPSWRERWVEPYRSAAQVKLSNINAD